MLKFYLNRWTISLMIAIIGVILYFIGYETIALVGTLTIISFIAMNATYKNPKAPTAAFISGTLIGLAGMAWIYAFTFILALLIYLYGPMKANSSKLMMSFLFGVLTPLWIYFPFYFYFNQEAIAHTMFTFDIRDFFSEMFL